MRGNVIGFDPDTNTGAISGHDGHRYDFVTGDWHGAVRPHHGDLVDFVPIERRATQVYLIEPQYVRPGFGQFYFSPHGRISRSQFWLRAILPIWGIWLLLWIMTFASAVNDNKAAAGLFGFLLLLYGLAIIWPALVTNIKRIHDRNKSGWFILIPLIPGVLTVIVWTMAIIGAVASALTKSDAALGYAIGAGAFTWVLGLVSLAISIWFFVEFGCMRGTIGANRFGPDPVARV